MFRLLTILTIVLSSLAAFSQNGAGDKKIVQFSGVVYDIDSNSVIPYVTLKNQSSGKAYSANYKGYFSFVVHEGDSILLSSVGYKKTTVIVPKNIKEKKFTVLVKMKSDNIELPVVRVFPWASTDEFKRDFMTMKFADDDYEIAKKNIKKTMENGFYFGVPMDGAEIQGMTFNNQHIGLSNKNMVQTNPLLNPLAWASFLKQISEGSKSKNK
ncbi:carboxypeptidase-like regulatory domain-containing protein [Pseudopedobacter beijingensis]|uniref:Carboxypeptidase-like regulatory domain-containing protein n=1 Tax=Pseudopedobacter beijingensis TaxID=1207056 RepID=A0ABW4ICB3_9SPHI